MAVRRTAAGPRAAASTRAVAASGVRAADPLAAARAGTDRVREIAPRSTISAARRYTPRGRTVRDIAEQRRAGRGGDPFRPALQLVRGGAASERSATRGGTRAGAGASARIAAGSGTRTAATASARAATSASARAATRTAAYRSARASGAPQTAATRTAPPRTDRCRVTDPRRISRPAAVRHRRVRRAVQPIHPPRLGDPRRRLGIATALVLVLFTVIAARLVQLQLTDAQAYAAEGLGKRLHTVVLGAPRGAIYDRNGAVLAHSVEARYVYADPSMIDDPAEVAARLSPLLGIPASQLLPKLTPHNRPDGRPQLFEWLARGVDIHTGDAVRALNIKGIGVQRDERREVPGHDLAANVIGFVGDDLHGLAGLEARYDNLLYGVNGERQFEIGQGDLAAEIPGGYLRETPAQPGTSLQLTIDRDLQYVVQQILAKRMRAANATFASAEVIDVRTGEVLALASYPPYDAADPFKVPAAQHGDVATGIVVDPGSTHKVITIGAALEEGVVTPQTTISVDPTIRKGDQDFRDTHWLPPGTKLSLPGVLAYSSNVATIKIADMLGAARLYEYQCRFGLGTPTGIGLPGEAAGLVQPPENWSGTSYGSIPIGAGVAVTPVQMASVYAAIANDGLWVQPHLVREMIKPDGTRVAAPEPQVRRVLSPSTAAALRQMLEAVVVAPNATGRSAAVPQYRVAGKTGTGQLVRNGRYAAGEVASFIGMAPVEAPRYVIAVFAYTPGGSGGVVAGPAFAEMMEFTLRHYRIPPTGNTPPTFVLEPSASRGAQR